MMMTMIALCICHPAVAMGAGKNIVRPSFNLLTAKLQSLAHLSRARAVLEWDQLVTMPQAETTSASRGAQLAALASVIHEKSTAAELGDAITAAEREAAAAAAVASDDDDAAATRNRAVIREARLEYDKEVNVPSELAERVALLGSEAYGAWAKARKLNDFNSFESTLARCFATAAELALARAGKTTASGEDGLAHSSTDSKTTTIPIISNEDDAYGLCLEEYEKGMGSARIDALFDEVEATLSPLIKRVLAAENQPSGHVLSPSSSSTLANSESSSPSSSSSSSSSSWPSSFPLDAQEKLNRAVVEAMGFDLSSGRVDVSVHPFTTSFGPKDVRITSRFNDQEWYQVKTKKG
jgi:Zn-dependent M32 family carboxypeptidase